ncbi:MlaE family ABC transporter permease [Euzebya rosea]|uniref:MlaE family ABC transporter permease n=1 Tax=Euzebya rosea TaxID=2052804 RepID=UPI000D3E231E|nr:ABC transporter permease [Euzebya rosea]
MSAIPAPLSRFGRRLGGPFENVYDQFAFYGEALRGMPRAFKYGGVILTLITDVAIGAGALVLGGGMFFVIGALAFFTGTAVGLEGYVALDQIGAEAYVGLVASFANTREITPLIAGVALAAQIGAGFTAEIGAMRISEEIDALEVMSVPSLVYLVSTRIWAALILAIPLYLLALFASYSASELIVTQYYTVSSGAYEQYFDLFLPTIDVLYSLTKAVVFTIFVVLVHCYYGYNASGGPAGVGIAVGNAIRVSLVGVVLLNLLLSVIFYGGGNTVRIA